MIFGVLGGDEPGVGLVRDVFSVGHRAEQPVADVDQSPALDMSESVGDDEGLGRSVERHLSDYFAGFHDTLPPPGLYHRVLKEVEYPLISAALAATRGNQLKAAALLGLNRNTLRKKIRELDIEVMRGPR